MSQIWVFLADPEDFGWNELERDGKAVWDGVKNAQAQRNIAKCEIDDVVLIYHTSPDKAVIGIARVASEPRPDPNDAARVVIDVAPQRRLQRALPLAELKADKVLSGMSFVKMPRVAVQPVTTQQHERVLELAGS